MRAAFFDVDGTLTTDRVWRGLMEYFIARRKRKLTHCFFSAVHYPLWGLARAGLLSQVAFRAQWAAHLPWYFRGFDDDQMKEMTDWVVVNYLRPLFREDTTQLLKDHLAQSDLVVLVSSGPTPLLARIGAEWGVEHVVGTVPAKKDGRFTGGVAGRVCIDETKASFARDYLSARGFKVDYAASYAYGDSTSDLGLLEMAGNPVAVYPDKGLKPIAAARGWRVFPG